MNQTIRYIFLVLLFTFSLNAQTIYLDEDFSDWDNISSLYTDSENDGINIDFGNLKIQNDDKFIYFYLEVGTEMNFQSNNDLVMYIDADANSATGKSVDGIGAELEYKIGEREGKYYYENNSETIYHPNIGLISLPTVTSNRFEFLINRDTKILDRLLFDNEKFNVLFRDERTDGDKLPNEDGGLEFQFTSAIYSELPYSIDKKDDENIRVLSYNVLFDNLHKSSRKNNFKRIFQALKPDIIGFQEIYDHSAKQTADLIKEFLPDQTWYYSSTNSDNIYVGKYPVINSYPIDGNSAFLLDLEDAGKEMLFISAHPPCCDNEFKRQKEIDHIMSLIRDLKNGTGPFTLQENSPIVIVGDMNLVGYAQQQQTLINGDIQNTGSYGEKFSPDWDDTDLSDVKPFATGFPAAITWYNGNSDFSPGRLDYIVHSNSVLELKNSFTLLTPFIDIDTLSNHGIESSDVILASDHLPTVADFSVKPLTNNHTENDNIPSKYNLFQNHPNPFNPSTTIEYAIPSLDTRQGDSVQINVFDVLGNKIKTLYNGTAKSGKHKIKFDGKNLASGTYFIKMNCGDFRKTVKALLVK
ncbi:MAG: endonuclease/exonuclease/phosphatase family protein [Melioribacteraceae bacterium]|nr:endonuclease/exonuclease/phosphatase family protein [Melioribacteraceae bacterium]